MGWVSPAFLCGKNRDSAHYNKEGVSAPFKTDATIQTLHVQQQNCQNSHEYITNTIIEVYHMNDFIGVTNELT